MNYLKHFPKPLLDDLVSGRWLPIVGAGLSRNAVFSTPRTMPLWNELGKSLADDMSDYDFVNPIDAISSYEHEFGRPKLIEKLSDLLGLREAQPGDAHRTFCGVQFDIVCSTNFDFLLERQYELTQRSCIPLIDEDQLSINLPDSSIALLKLHGDLNHPNRLIVTEEDYDKFLERYPIIATYLANLLITRTAVLIGYSLDDPDFRHVWQVVGERLGKARRLAYVLCVGAQSADVARFERRGVKVINLGGNKRKYGEILSKTFQELSAYWRDNIVPGSQIVEERSLRELSLPSNSATRLCFFSLPLSALPFYRDQVFPLVREAGLVPVTEGDVVSPGASIVAKLEALFVRASLVVIDVSSNLAAAKARIAVARARMAVARNEAETDKLLVIMEEGAAVPFNDKNVNVLMRPALASVEVQDFLTTLRDFLQRKAKELEPRFSHEARRLLSAREYRAAVISAITHLETTLREQLDVQSDRSRKRAPVRQMLNIASSRGFLGRFEVNQILHWLQIRNEIVHSNLAVSRQMARKIVQGVEDIIASLSL